MPGTKYYCTSCPDKHDPYLKTIRQNPRNAPDYIRTGCPECGTIRRFNRLGGIV